MTHRSLEILRNAGNLRVEHLAMVFTRRWSDSRRVSPAKLWELVRVVGRLLRLRFGGRIDCLLFPAGGPYRVPVLRDIALLPLCRLFTRGLVVHFHAAGIATALPTFPTLLRRLVCAVYRRCDAAIVLTAYGRVDAEALSIETIEVVPNTIPDSYRAEWRSADRSSTVRLLYVGHLSTEKGTPQLLAAVGAIRAGHPDLELHILGEPVAPYTQEQFTEDVRAAKLWDSVHLHGVVDGDEKWRHFARADLFVFPSTFAAESFGLVLLEAMMWELPVVATNWRANAEVLGQPVGGICYHPGDDPVRALTHALADALARHDEWRAWGARNRRHFQNFLFSADDEPLARFVKKLTERR